jgi:hypothetical protein
MDEEKDTKYREKIIDSEGDELKTQVNREYIELPFPDRSPSFL